MMDNLIRDGVLSQDLENFTIDHLVTFDIEVIQKQTEDQQVLSPISIGVASTFTSDEYFERNSSLPQDGDSMVFRFLDYLVEIYELYKSL